MPKRDNVESFAFLYEYVAEPLEKGLAKATDSVDIFVDTTTKGLTMVTDWVSKTTVKLAELGGKKVLSSVGRVGKGLFAWGRSTFQIENRLGGVVSALKFIGKIGGLAVLLGPLLPLIKPFMMLVGVISDTLQPAMDTLKNAITGAFAPLSVAFHRLSVKVLPYIMKFLDPIVAMMVKFVDNIGEFIDSGALDDMLSVFDDLLPLIKDIASSFVRDFLKPVGGTLFRTLIRMFKSLVTFAVQFIEAIKPYLPRFFMVMQKIANLILKGLGDAFETLLEEFAKTLKDPEFIGLLWSMVELFEKLTPIIVKLLPPLMKLLALFIAKFLTPLAIKLLDKMVDGLINLVDALDPAIDDLGQFLTDMVNWWETNEDVVGQVADGIIKALGKVIEYTKGAIEWISKMIDDTVEALRILGIVEEKASVKKQREKEEAGQAAFEQTQAAPGVVAAQWDKNITRTIERLRKAGWDEQRLAFKKAEMEIQKQQAVTAAKIRMRQMAGGGYVRERELVEVAEVTPEWVVPDTPEGVMEYLPRMLKSVMKGKPTGAAAGEGMTTVNILKGIHRTLESIEQVLMDQAEATDEMLPEGL